MSAPSARPSSDRALVWLFAGMVALALALLSQGWNASLLDRYEFRQLQTALSTWWIVQEGWQLDYLTPLFGPPWSVPMEFPTYQLLVAAWRGLSGMPLEQSGRLVGIVMFLACLPAVYDLLEIAGLARSRRLIVLVVVLSAPVYLFYARTFMIETTALCFSVWFLAALRRALTGARGPWLPVALAAGTLAALTKVTTFLVFGPPAVALVVLARRHPPATRARRAIGAVLAAALPLGLAWWWFRHGDAVKDSNPFTGFLTARELHDWNFGAFSLRFRSYFWLHLQETVTAHNLAEGALAVALLCTPFAPARSRAIAGVAVLGFLSGPLVFANLYHVHDYYYAGNALLLLAAAGLMVAAAWDDPRLPRGANWLALGVLLACQLNAFHRGYQSHYRHPAPPPPALAATIREHVPADGVVLVYGADWDPLLPYYFQRRAVMVPGERERETDILEQVLARLPPRHIAAMVVHGDKLRGDAAFIRDRAARFGLSSQPAASEGPDSLYLPAEAGSLIAPAALAPDDFPADLPAEQLIGPALALFHPAPRSVRSRYGTSFAEVSGRPVLNAHAPSEIILPVPTGARHVTAVAGLADGAYAAGGAVVTDGVTVDILARWPDGRMQSLRHRRLDPAAAPGDRGPQSFECDLPPGFAGELVFRLGNGPAGNPANDWSYWAGIAVR